MDCPFCHPADRVVLRNRTALALLSDPRKVPGHTLVIPQRHVTEPWRLRSDEWEDIGWLLQQVQRNLTEAVNGGADVRQHYRPFMPQGLRYKVDHLHYHVLPRTMEDELYQRVECHETAMFEPLPADEALRFAEVLRGISSPQLFR